MSDMLSRYVKQSMRDVVYDFEWDRWWDSGASQDYYKRVSHDFSITVNVAGGDILTEYFRLNALAEASKMKHGFGLFDVSFSEITEEEFNAALQDSH